MRYYAKDNNGNPNPRRSFSNPRTDIETIGVEPPDDSIQYPKWDDGWIDDIDRKRESTDLDAETLETKLLDMGLLDDVEALAKNNKKWEIRWRRNRRISRTDADLEAGAKQLWPDDYEAKLDALFGIE